MRDDEAFDDLALQRLSVPAPAPGGMSRRRFLQLTGGGVGLAAGAVALTPMLEQMRAFAAPPIGPTDGVLVLLMLDGGNDGLNMVVPNGTSRYYELRPASPSPRARSSRSPVRSVSIRHSPASRACTTRARSRSSAGWATGRPT